MSDELRNAIKYTKKGLAILAVAGLSTAFALGLIALTRWLA